MDRGGGKRPFHPLPLFDRLWVDAVFARDDGSVAGTRRMSQTRAGICLGMGTEEEEEDGGGAGGGGQRARAGIAGRHAGAPAIGRALAMRRPRPWSLVRVVLVHFLVVCRLLRLHFTR